ncbi:MAG: hypothetical protein ACI3X1_02215 [Eubacteriales bacterium]
MAKHRINKFSRRTRSQYKKSKAPIVLAVIAFLLLSLIISVAIGLMLSKRAEQSGLPDKRFDFEKVEYISNGKTVSSVEAYNFPRGSSAPDYISQGISDLSVCLRHSDGGLDYHLDIADRYGEVREGAVSFSELCRSAHAANGRVCAYIYVTSFAISDAYERGIMQAYELALINEAARSGADDILLLGLSATEENIAEVEEFVARAAIAAENTPLGVSVGTSLLDLTDNEIYLAARLRKNCDYIALDLTHMVQTDGESGGVDGDGHPLPSLLEATLEKYQYYIKSYEMRILFAKEESKLYVPALELGVVDLQIVGK